MYAPNLGIRATVLPLCLQLPQFLIFWELCRYWRRTYQKNPCSWKLTFLNLVKKRVRRDMDIPPKKGINFSWNSEFSELFREIDEIVKLDHVLKIPKKSESQGKKIPEKSGHTFNFVNFGKAAFRLLSKFIVSVSQHEKLKEVRFVCFLRTFGFGIRHASFSSRNVNKL